MLETGAAKGVGRLVDDMEIVREIIHEMMSRGWGEYVPCMMVGFMREIELGAEGRRDEKEADLCIGGSSVLSL